MRSINTSQAGSSLIEVVIAMGVLVVGALGTAGVFTQGMQKATSSPGDLLATQKAAEAIESVFAARDSQKLTWAQVRNVIGESGADGGLFLDGPRQLLDPGPDGIVNTNDDGEVETERFPGPDRLLNTRDDEVRPLSSFRREIKITRVSDDVRAITVTVTFPDGANTRKFVLTTLISSYS
jgi:hypothetical protein